MSTTALPDSTPNAYALPELSSLCFVSEKHHIFECPPGTIRPEWELNGNIIGCGLLLYQNDKLAIFFTVNGKLMGQYCDRLTLKNKFQI
jgi:hypothetical protein